MQFIVTPMKYILTAIDQRNLHHGWGVPKNWDSMVQIAQRNLHNGLSMAQMPRELTPFRFPRILQRLNKLSVNGPKHLKLVPAASGQEQVDRKWCKTSDSIPKPLISVFLQLPFVCVSFLWNFPSTCNKEIPS